MKEYSNLGLWIDARQRLIDHPTEGRDGEDADALFMKVYDRVIAMYNRGEFTQEREDRYVDVCTKMAWKLGRLRNARFEARLQRSLKCSK